MCESAGGGGAAHHVWAQGAPTGEESSAFCPPSDSNVLLTLGVCSGPGVCAGAAGDAEQGGSAAAERRSVGGALCEGQRSAGGGKSTARCSGVLNVLNLTL